MNYQEIYKGLNKKASAEQVKELAGMIKKAQLKKKADTLLPVLAKKALPAITQSAGAIVAPAISQGGAIAGKTLTKSVKAPLFNRVGEWLAKNPKKAIGGALGLTAGAGVGGFAAGNAGKAELKGALDKANETSTKLVEENKKLKAGSGSLWEDILKALGQWWSRLSKSWNAGTEKTLAAPAPAATEAVKK